MRGASLKSDVAIDDRKIRSLEFPCSSLGAPFVSLAEQTSSPPSTCSADF